MIGPVCRVSEPMCDKSDAPLITTVVAGVPRSRHPRALTELVDTAVDL